MASLAVTVRLDEPNSAREGRLNTAFSDILEDIKAPLLKR